jgi:hypothetical protein
MAHRVYDKNDDLAIYRWLTIWIKIGKERIVVPILQYLYFLSLSQFWKKK